MPHFLSIYRLTENISQRGLPDLFDISEDFEKPWHRLDRDWFGEKIIPACAFSLLLDKECLHFLAVQELKALGHPEENESKYMKELWKYDVAELFLSNPENGEYLEFNLSPQGAWWSCTFSEPRQMKPLKNQQLEAVTVHHTKTNRFCFNCLSIPLRSIRKSIDLAIEQAHANITFITNSPDQTFISYCALTGDQPDFHQPEQFAKTQIFDLL